MKKTLIISLFLANLTVSLQSCRNSEDTQNHVAETIVNPNNFKIIIKNGQTITLDASKIYNLTGPVIVKNGGILNIPAGTRIESTAGTNGYVLVEQGGKININGTASQPVIFTSPNKTAGDWGGIVICGRAPINTGATNASSEVGASSYGGTQPDDNSGTLRYLRIEYAGAVFNAEKEFNGLSLFGVGRGTTVEYIQVYASNDDGVEWFGGSVDANYLIVNGADDDAFDWTEGWNGIGKNWFASRFENRGNRGIEADNNSNNNAVSPFSYPKISNITLVGSNHGSESHGIKLRAGTKGQLHNVVLVNWKTGVDIQHDVTLQHIAHNELKLSQVKFENVSNKFKGTTSENTSADVSVAISEDSNATGAGNGALVPNWAKN